MNDLEKKFRGIQNTFSCYICKHRRDLLIREKILNYEKLIEKLSTVGEDDYLRRHPIQCPTVISNRKSDDCDNCQNGWYRRLGAPQEQVKRCWTYYLTGKDVGNLIDIKFYKTSFMFLYKQAINYNYNFHKYYDLVLKREAIYSKDSYAKTRNNPPKIKFEELLVTKKINYCTKGEIICIPHNNTNLIMSKNDLQCLSTVQIYYHNNDYSYDYTGWGGCR